VQQNPTPSLRPDHRPNHLLIIRFSSFGDIVQALGVPKAFLQRFRDSANPSRVDWLVRTDFSSLLTANPSIHQTLAFSREEGLWGLLQRAWTLAQSHQYTHLYDAHNNLRSNLFCAAFLASKFYHRQSRKQSLQFARRPKNRLRRWLFFRLRLQVLPRPFRGAESFLWPLKDWGLLQQIENESVFYSSSDDLQKAKGILQKINLQTTSASPPFIALVPSAAWQMKRWSVENWCRLVGLMNESHFVILGGPDDSFCKTISDVAPDRVLNLAGQTPLGVSCAILRDAKLVISGDTGLLHVADQIGTPALALIGPTAFGYPSHPTSHIVEVQLPCKPCSKDGSGKCRNSVYQLCMRQIDPLEVARRAHEILGSQQK
jgi:ADP-heptose:LPS heptosyltransferase